MAQNPDLVIVGSVAFDSVQSPAGVVEEALGGSAIYCSIAASFFCKVGIVAVVGEDFPEGHRTMLHERGIDTAGLVAQPGETFRWKGVYSDDFSSRTTLETCLNVFADFSPKIPEAYRGAKLLFLGNISPELQGVVLSQMMDLDLAVMDTMNFWIESDRETVFEIMSRCGGVMINDEEARSISEEANLVKAARFTLDRGPRFALVKKGEHGCLLAGSEGLFSLPSYPIENVCDPTGAGDTFAGGFLGYLAQCGGVSWESLKGAAAAGTALASFAVEGFSVEGLAHATKATIGGRICTLAEMCSFVAPSL